MCVCVCVYCQDFQEAVYIIAKSFPCKILLGTLRTSNIEKPNLICTHSTLAKFCQNFSLNIKA